MDEAVDAGSTLIISDHWSRRNEVAATTRAVAGAASRFSEVVVAVPGRSGMTSADGAFDIHQFSTEGWERSASSLSFAGRPLTTYQHVIIDELKGELNEVASHLTSSQRVFLVHGGAGGGSEHRYEHLRFLPLPKDDSPFLGMHVPINPLAATHRHNGLGFTGYILVLSDRVDLNDPRLPTDMVAWITAGCHQSQVVVIEDGAAAVWQGRALRGVVGVDTRTDMWRLFAHAQCVVDLAPGPVIARECIESLRFGTPVVVPADSAAAAHTWSGGGMVFSNVAGLLQALDQLADASQRSEVGAAGKQYADANFGVAAGFVRRLANYLVG
jgi:hypothetical protein